MPVGQTLETMDIYLPHKVREKLSNKNRPVIIVDKNSKEEYVVIPGSTKRTGNTTYYGKHGIKFYRHNIEIVDNEGKAIKQNEKFKVTKNSSKLPQLEVERIKDKVVNHTKFSTENKRKYQEFKNRK